MDKVMEGLIGLIGAIMFLIAVVLLLAMLKGVIGMEGSLSHFNENEKMIIEKGVLDRKEVLQ